MVTLEIMFDADSDHEVEIDSAGLLAALERADRYSDLLEGDESDEFLEQFMAALSESIVVTEPEGKNGFLVLSLGEPAISMLPPEV
jgi:hypothetical protein